MIRDFTPRLYQQTILGTAANKNTLVVLPTGLGKTAIALLLAAQRLNNYPKDKILFLAPTKPLCEQHLQTFRKHLVVDGESIVLFTGEISPEKRAELWKKSRIIVSTPQGLENDVINARVKLEEVSLLIFDEAHHATGEYSYVWLANQYNLKASHPRILAMTASPGSDLEKVSEICKNLHIEKVEVRTEKDPDVKPYVQEVKIEWMKVDFPESYKTVQKQLKECKKSKILQIKNNKFCQGLEMSKGELLKLQIELQRLLVSGERSFELLKSISLLAEALKVDHAIELLETQGIRQLHSYLSRIQEESKNTKVKAVKNLMQDHYFLSAIQQVKSLLDREIVHPKMEKLISLVNDEVLKNNSTKIIIFTQYRDSAEEIVNKLSELRIKANIFVGQAKKNGIGFTQKQQKEIITRFRENEFNVLVATSVAEEGLDIPKVDKVIFYEPVPSAIRSIQRRGRTGRLEKGEVTILMTSDTHDEIYRWSSNRKEKKMYSTLEKIKKELNWQREEKEIKLPKFIKEDQVVAVLADHREDNKIVKELVELGISVKTGQLSSADYILSEKVGVELKKIPDFISSIIDGRLLGQIKELRNNFDKAVLIIEGDEDIYSIRKVHPNAIRGMLASIVLDFQVPVLYTKNPKDTAGLLAIMAKREQERSRELSFPGSKPRTVQEQQEFVVSSFPGIGMATAKKLLLEFKSLKNLVNSTKEELVKIDGVGDKTADRLLELFKKEYLKE